MTSEPLRRHATASSTDRVVLVDDSGRPIGTADRLDVHTAATPLHLAFSTYLFNARGDVLVTRRALGKRTWPGVWTNSCCGHPRPGESVEDAARRRIREELGLHVGPLTPLLPDFRYLATDASGIVENEICPVFAAFVADEDPRPDPTEVAEWCWVPWTSLTTAVAATPSVYSPWSALQVPRIAERYAGLPHLQTSRRVDVAAAIRDVDAVLSGAIDALAEQWQDYTTGLDLDVLPQDLPRWLADLLVGRGKRIRVTMAYWAYISAGGVHGAPAYHRLLRVTAAVEALHLFALIHDDVMDESVSRRGKPSAHVQASTWHQQAGGLGDDGLFGRNMAILLGDLAHTLADRLVEGLPTSLQEIWYALCFELIAGQRADLTGAAAGRRDKEHAEHVARLKSGRYTVVRPLQLGATAAGAPDEIVTALMECGEHIGRAFALRDDYLGVWGDPVLTGKPAGDDLLEAKATMVLALAKDRLRGGDAELLSTVGTPSFQGDMVPHLSTAMRNAGVDTEVEKLIAESFSSAMDRLRRVPLTSQGVEGLRSAAHAVAWRAA